MKFHQLNERMGKTKSAVAIARRLVCLLWLLVTRREFYADISREGLMKRFRRYKITYEGLEGGVKPRCGFAFGICAERKTPCTNRATVCASPGKPGFLQSKKCAQMRFLKSPLYLSLFQNWSFGTTSSINSL
jgi:hypothetical protein